MEPHFQSANPTDLDGLLVLIREYYAFDGHPFDEAALRPVLAALIQDPTLGRIWLICDGEQIIGYVALTLGYSLEYLGRDAFVDELYIRESHRGQGLGTRAIDFLAGVCRALGVRALHLEVLRHNTRAQHLYRKLGFVDQDRFLMTRRF